MNENTDTPSDDTSKKPAAKRTRKPKVAPEATMMAATDTPAGEVVVEKPSRLFPLRDFAARLNRSLRLRPRRGTLVGGVLAEDEAPRIAGTGPAARLMRQRQRFIDKGRIKHGAHGSLSVLENMLGYAPRRAPAPSGPGMTVDRPSRQNARRAIMEAAKKRASGSMHGWRYHFGEMTQAARHAA